jgi:ATP adenylyltransferase
MEYLQAEKDAPEGAACVFCELLAGRAPQEERVLVRNELAFATLAKYPYNPGHVLVLPTRHTGDIEDVSAGENAAMQTLVQRTVRALREVSEPHGFNVGLNLGREAGAGIPGHLHWHVVPRWSGDTNFMPVIGETRVLPELLAETYAKLKPRFDQA